MLRRSIVAVSLLVAGRAAAQPAAAGPIQIAWDAPAPCPSLDRVRAKVDELLGGAPPADSPRRVNAKAVVSQTADGFELALLTESHGEVGQRELRGSSCDALADAAALIIALAFDPEAVAAAADRAVTPAPVPVPAPVPPPVPVPLPAPPPIAPPPPRVVPIAPAAPREPLYIPLGIHAGADIGSLPAVAAGVGLSAGLDAPIAEPWRLRALLRGTFYLPQHAALAGQSALGGDFDFLAAGLAGCPLLRFEDVDVGLCLGVELGRMAAEGFGVTLPVERAVLWAAMPIGATGGWRFADPLALRLDLGAAVPFTRPQWLLEGIGNVDRPGAIAARLFGGLELQL